MTYAAFVDALGRDISVQTAVVALRVVSWARIAGTQGTAEDANGCAVSAAGGRTLWSAPTPCRCCSVGCRAKGSTFSEEGISEASKSCAVTRDPLHEYPGYGAPRTMLAQGTPYERAYFVIAADRQFTQCHNCRTCAATTMRHPAMRDTSHS